jgi:hypothetical protein
MVRKVPICSPSQGLAANKERPDDKRWLVGSGTRSVILLGYAEQAFVAAATHQDAAHRIVQPTRGNDGPAHAHLVGHVAIASDGPKYQSAARFGMNSV